MSRVLITSWGSFGDVYPYLGVALALKARGHSPLLAMPRFYGPLVEGLGLDFRSVGLEIDPNDHATIAKVMDPVKGGEVLIRDLLMPSLRADYASLHDAARDVDLMVTHPITFAAPLVAAVRGLPWVSTVLAPMSFFSASDVPVPPAAPRLVHLRRLGPWVGALMSHAVHRVTRPWLEAVDVLRQQLGLPLAGHPLFEGQFSPTLTLALFSRVLAVPQHDWPANVTVTGAVFYNGPDALQAELAAFLDAGPAPAVFTLGTSAVGAAGTFYEEAVAAAVQLGVRAVLLTGGFARNVPSRPVPPSVLLIDRAPHQLLFPRASAVVHQGGAGTTAQALRAGRPMIVVPHGHDQPDNAFRVSNLGVARTVFPTAFRARHVARELGALLTDEAARARALEVARIVQAEGGAIAAADAIARLL